MCLPTGLRWGHHQARAATGAHTPSPNELNQAQPDHPRSHIAEGDSTPVTKIAGPTLLVMPPSILTQWALELQAHSNLKVK